MLKVLGFVENNLLLLAVLSAALGLPRIASQYCRPHALFTCSPW